MTVLKRGKLVLFQRALVKTVTVKKKVAPSKVEERKLFVSLSFISEDLFCESLLTI